MLELVYSYHTHSRFSLFNSEDKEHLHDTVKEQIIQNIWAKINQRVYTVCITTKRHLKELTKWDSEIKIELQSLLQEAITDKT